MTDEGKELEVDNERNGLWGETPNFKNNQEVYEMTILKPFLIFLFACIVGIFFCWFLMVAIADEQEAREQSASGATVKQKGVQQFNYKSRTDISMPCCVAIPKNWASTPHTTYDDYNVLSPKKTVHIWKEAV